uniref:Uncharacterized protein n=1 Tax=Oryza punctata TaxID=4537 RepID=A0A0E0JGX3_ORYPU
MSNFTYYDIMIPWSFVNCVKAEFGSRHVVAACSVFDEVTAAIWQCCTRAIHSHGGGVTAAPTLLVFAANMGKHVGAKDGYYGNCITRQVVAATADVVASGDIVNLARLINDAKEWIPELLPNKQQHPSDCRRRVVPGQTSGSRGVDFGGGRPAQVVPNMEMKAIPGCVLCLLCSRKDGVHALICVSRTNTSTCSAPNWTLQ